MTPCYVHVYIEGENRIMKIMKNSLKYSAKYQIENTATF